MKKNVLRFFVAAITMLLMVGTATAQKRGDDSNKPSKNAEATGQIGNAKIRVTYGAPKVKGRTAFGGLVPWGKTWRAGANEATTVTFSKDVKVNGQDLSAGIYGFFLIPKEEGSWTLIFNKVANQWGAFDYDESKDALRVEAAPEATENQEALLYTIESSGNQGTLSVNWATTKVSVTIEAE